MDDLLRKIEKKKLLFSVTTGRSGTNYLSFLLSLLKDTRSEHEGKPGFHEYYRDILQGKYTFNEFWLKKKLPYIANEIEEGYYADVSHVACKGFLEPLLELGIKPSFVLIKRNNRDVAKSLLQLNTIPLRTNLGLTYLNSPSDPGVLKLVCNYEELTDYQLCFWYTLEMDRRLSFYKQYFIDQGCPYVYITFEELIGGEGITKIRKELDLPPMSVLGWLRFLRNKKAPLNDKKASKRNLIPVDFDEEEIMLRDVIQWQ
ncbi:MAG TPA: hypothetical protein VFW11_20350 [Cyclobacteriaceae bacterium]|nr:hypothetical protein [Cyclobacteriaceae bacterium]